MCCTGCFRIQCAQHIYCPCIGAVERRRLVASSFRLGTILGMDAGIALEQLCDARGTPTEAVLQKLLDNSAVPEHIFLPEEIAPGVLLSPGLAEAVSAQAHPAPSTTVLTGVLPVVSASVSVQQQVLARPYFTSSTFSAPLKFFP
jgi:hypothetical protein